MDTSRRSESPTFTISDDGGRPLIVTSGATSKFRPGQLVYLTVPGQEQPEGPYKILSVIPGIGKYTLCFADGRQARNGQEVEEKDLKAA